MKYLLDTDSISYALRGYGNIGARIRACHPTDLCMSAITLADLRYGANRKASRRLHSLIDAFAAAVKVESFDESAALEFGRIANLLSRRGAPIGEFDVLIAAHAVALQCILVTDNIKHFSRIKGLPVENWT